MLDVELQWLLPIGMAAPGLLSETKRFCRKAHVCLHPPPLQLLPPTTLLGYLIAPPPHRPCILSEHRPYCIQTYPLPKNTETRPFRNLQIILRIGLRSFPTTRHLFGYRTMRPTGACVAVNISGFSYVENITVVPVARWFAVPVCRERSSSNLRPRSTLPSRPLPSFQAPPSRIGIEIRSRSHIRTIITRTPRNENGWQDAASGVGNDCARYIRRSRRKEPNANRLSEKRWRNPPRTVRDEPFRREGEGNPATPSEIEAMLCKIFRLPFRLRCGISLESRPHRSPTPLCYFTFVHRPRPRVLPASMLELSRRYRKEPECPRR